MTTRILLEGGKYALMRQGPNRLLVDSRDTRAWSVVAIDSLPAAIAEALVVRCLELEARHDEAGEVSPRTLRAEARVKVLEARLARIRGTALGRYDNDTPCDEDGDDGIR